jgi:dTDP-4-amino-4,6-dideoxygalactose transaminase
LSQLARLDDYVARRHRIAERYEDALRDLPLQLPWQHPDGYSSYHLYPVRVPHGVGKRSQRQVYDALQAVGINVNLHYIPVYRQPYYKSLGFTAGYCPEAEKYYRETISLPMFPTLSDTDQMKVISVLSEAMQGN